jgi:hypothetical protein
MEYKPFDSIAWARPFKGALTENRVVSADASLRMSSNVRKWHETDLDSRCMNVGYWGKSGSSSRAVKVTRLTLNGPRPRVVQYGQIRACLSITSRANSIGGTSGPSAFAVFRLITSSNLTSGHATAPGASLAHRRLYRRDRKWLAKNATSQAWSRFPEAINDTALGRRRSPAQ